MAKSVNNKKAPAKRTGAKKPRKKGLTTQELMRKHLNDPDHNISEEEFKNVEFDTQVAKKDLPDLPEGDDRPHDVDKDHRMKTPWDVLNEG